MPRSPAASLLLPLAALLALSSCSMPTEPEGAGEEGLTRLAGRLQAQGDDEGAADFYQRALQRHPDNVAALRNLGAIFEAHGNTDAAETYYAKALSFAPDDKDLQHAEGRALVRLGRAGEARDLYKKILNDDKQDVKALNGFGIASDYLGQHDEAQSSYRRALELDPQNLVTLNNLAHSYVLAGAYDQAIQLLEPHAADKAASPALRQNLAEAYGLAGMTADAERLARVDLKPQDVKRNLAAYKARRARLALEPKFVADLGSYPTRDMADALALRAQSLVSDDTIKIATKPDVQTIGGTPRFALVATGFDSAANVKKFCDQLLTGGIGCTLAKRP